MYIICDFLHIFIMFILLTHTYKHTWKLELAACTYISGFFNPKRIFETTAFWLLQYRRRRAGETSERSTREQKNEITICQCHERSSKGYSETAARVDSPTISSSSLFDIRFLPSFSYYSISHETSLLSILFPFASPSQKSTNNPLGLYFRPCPVD